MKQLYFDVHLHGFYGAYYENPHACQSSVILLLGEDVDNYMVKTGVHWLHRRGLNVLVMAPSETACGYFSFPLERFGLAIDWLKNRGNQRFGIVGASATAAIAMLAASYYPDLTLTLCISPCDFVMEGFHRDHLDGAWERPADGRSIVTWQGMNLPYVPYAYRHPEYCRKLDEEAKQTGNLVASRQMFDRSELLHPVTDAEAIKVEKIRGRLLLCGAEDDCLWDTCRYIRRICQRLRTHAGKCRCKAFLYPVGTHFLAPQSMVRTALPVAADLIVLPFRAGRKDLIGCRDSRRDQDARLIRELEAWIQE